MESVSWIMTDTLKSNGCAMAAAARKHRETGELEDQADVRPGGRLTGVRPDRRTGVRARVTNLSPALSFLLIDPFRIRSYG
jgi:hypothetical protein